MVLRKICRSESSEGMAFQALAGARNALLAGPVRDDDSFETVQRKSL